MAGWSTNARMNVQNRALQKSIREKYYQRLKVTISDNRIESRLELSEQSGKRAYKTRIEKLVKKAIIAIVLFIPFAYYFYKWIDSNLISF